MYKRQILSRAGLDLSDARVKTTDTVQNPLMGKEKVISGDTSVTVSYTHLDVYKRQGFTQPRLHRQILNFGICYIKAV